MILFLLLRSGAPESTPPVFFLPLSEGTFSDRIETWVEVHYAAQPDGEPFWVEAGEKVHWLQEQQATIEALQAQVQQLTERLESLEGTSP